MTTFLNFFEKKSIIS